VPADVAEALGELLDGSHRLAPGDLATAVADAARALGATDAVIHHVDLEQHVLVPLGGGAALDIDGTLAGRVYRHSTPLSATEDHVTRLWLPLLDGADRHGALSMDIPGDVDEALQQSCERFASLVALLLVSKAAIGDVLHLPARRRPMALAAEMRWAMLPPLSFANDQVQIAGVLEPAYEVAGDTFDYAVNDTIVHVAIFDAMGHGLQASRIANLVVVSYRHSRRQGIGLVDALRTIDALVTREFGPDCIVTGQLAELDVLSGVLRLVSAGHPPPLLLRRDRVVGEVACASTFPLGFGDLDIAITEVALEPGDQVAFYTDGITEARSPSGEEFGVSRLGDHLARAVGAHEKQAETLRRLLQSVQAHEAGALRDDATVVLLGWPDET
jgi:serine phosphatase RsbU (regulator of sigma subunit)